MNKKIVVIIIAIIGVIAFVIVFVFAKIHGQKTSATCKNTKTGWECEFKNEKTTLEYENTCRVAGGRWTCFGMCLPEYTHYCDFPFDDAGKVCLNSQECKGTCTVPREYVEKNYPNRKEFEDVDCTDTCTGTCTKYPTRDCEWWFEIHNNIVEDHTDILCD